MFKNNGLLINYSTKPRKFTIHGKAVEKAAEKAILYSYALYRQYSDSYSKKVGLRASNSQTFSIHWWALTAICVPRGFVNTITSPA